MSEKETAIAVEHVAQNGSHLAEITMDIPLGQSHSFGYGVRVQDRTPVPVPFPFVGIYPGIEQMVFDKRLAQVDDLYDAAAAAWTAERIIKQQAKVVSDAEVDSRGLTMQITY